MRARKCRGEQDTEGHKQVMLKALQEWRKESAPGFVEDQQKRSAKYLNDIRAAGRAIATNWQKVEAGTKGLAELNRECWDREHLSQAQQPASKRFKQALEKAMPGPMVLDLDDDDESKGDAK